MPGLMHVASLPKVQGLLCHDDFSTTHTYVGVTRKRLKDADLAKYVRRLVAPDSTNRGE